MHEYIISSSFRSASASVLISVQVSQALRTSLDREIYEKYSQIFIASWFLQYTFGLAPTVWDSNNYVLCLKPYQLRRTSSYFFSIRAFSRSIRP